MTTETLGRAPRFKARVTQEIIARSVARNSNHCMIAEAIKEAYPNLKYISVDIQTIRATDPEKRERYVWLTPRRNQVAIIDYDRGQPPRPFGFELRDGQTIVSGKLTNRGKRAKKASMRKPKNGNAQSVPERVGGKAPPRSIGQRRQFGLRRLEY